MNETVTRNELEIHLKGIDDRITFNEHVNDVKISAIKDMLEQNRAMLEQNTATIKAIVEKNIAEHKSIASKMSAEISEIRGDVKALSAKVDSIQIKFGWAITGLGIGITILLFLFQKFFN